MQQKKTDRHNVRSCIWCGYTKNAAINGARNILAVGHAVPDLPVEGGGIQASCWITNPSRHLRFCWDPRPLGPRSVKIYQFRDGGKLTDTNYWLSASNLSRNPVTEIARLSARYRSFAAGAELCTAITFQPSIVFSISGEPLSPGNV